jgi:murein DD-endopeptidase MepM/ murein hydrolase activator NlpD
VAQFELDPAYADAGRVNVADVTFVDPATHPSGKFEITFGAIRWNPVSAAPLAIACFDAPVGTEAERAGVLAPGRWIGQAPVWVGNWYDANPYGSIYQLASGPAYHTGADLNLSGPGGVLADKDAPVYACADGLVMYAGYVSAGWKNVIIIEHPVPNEGRVVYARYAHVGNLQVQTSTVVRRGQLIATVGEYAPNNYHLHFDISPNPVLKTAPGHWPGNDLAAVQQAYVDPLAFLKRYHVAR